MSISGLPCTPTDLGLIAAAIDNADEADFGFGGLSADNIEALIDGMPARDAAQALMVKALGDQLLQVT